MDENSCTIFTPILSKLESSLKISESKSSIARLKQRIEKLIEMSKKYDTSVPVNNMEEIAKASGFKFIIKDILGKTIFTFGENNKCGTIYFTNTQYNHIDNGNKYYCEYTIMNKRETPCVLFEEIICKKYQVEPTPENQETVRKLIQQRVYSYKERDSKKKKRYITFEDAEKLDDYVLNTTWLDLFHQDKELQKLHHLEGKKICDLSFDEKKEMSDYIATTLQPILLYKGPGDNKLLVNEIPEVQTVSYKELCDILITNTEECSYCKCKLSIISSEYSSSGLSFDSIIPLYGHTKENSILCCRLCNSKKGHRNMLEI